MTRISDEQIRKLRAVAIGAGDSELICVCDNALAYHPAGKYYMIAGRRMSRAEARAVCARVIAESK